jgi:hypothetical protein
LEPPSDFVPLPSHPKWSVMRDDNNRNHMKGYLVRAWHTTKIFLCKIAFESKVKDEAELAQDRKGWSISNLKTPTLNFEPSSGELCQRSSST